MRCQAARRTGQRLSKGITAQYAITFAGHTQQEGRPIARKPTARKDIRIKGTTYSYGTMGGVDVGNVTTCDHGQAIPVADQEKMHRVPKAGCMIEALQNPAFFSSCRRYRYLLMRRVSLDEPTCLFIMLNPSTADETQDDPTVRRCMGFARRWGFGVLAVANIFAWRATNPRELYDPGVVAVGPDNNIIIETAADEADKIICAWGNHGLLYQRGARVKALTDFARHKRYHLGLTKERQPRHPLYNRNDVVPVPML